MSNAKRDSNFVPTLMGVTDDANLTPTNLIVDPTTKRLKVSAVVASGVITSLGGLTTAVQLLSTGTAGTDFAITSAGSTHTFNIPTASATNRGLLSSTDWTTFNNKLSSFTANLPLSYSGGSISISQASATGTGYLIGADWTTFNNKADYSFGANNFSGSGNFATTGSVTVSGNVGIGTTSPANKLEVAGNIGATVHNSYSIGSSGSAWGTVFTNNIQVNNTAVFDAEYSNGNSGTTLTINWNNGNKQSVAMSDNCTFTFTAPPGACNLLLRITQTSLGTAVATWPTIKWSGGSVLSSTGTATDILSLYYSGSLYYGMMSLNFI